MNELTRRKFLAGAATAGALGLCGCEVGEDPYALVKPEVPGAGHWSKGEEKWIPSVCGQCPAGCGVRVRVVEGRAVKIEGHADHPINRGGLGPKGQSGLQVLYSPNRIRTPLRRHGRRGGGFWNPITWEEAIAEIAKTLRELRAGGEPRALAVLDGEPRGMTRELWVR
ncbi:MAG: twin-arginine translocation signal domain-containing protein, partial [Planctomycetota bacterium]